MGRYIIDNPEPPGAMEQFRGNVNRLGQTMLQLKMAEIERKRKLEEDIAGEGRKMQGELGLLREKAKIEQEAPMFKLGIKEKIASTSKAMDSTIPEAANYLGVNYQDLFGTEEQPVPTGQGTSPISMDVNPNLSGGITTQKPVFGNLIPETYENKMNRITGQRTVEPKTFLNPAAEKLKNQMDIEKATKIEEMKPYSADEIKIASGISLIPQIDKLINLVESKDVYEGVKVPFGASRISAFGEVGPWQSFKRGLTAGPGREAGLILQDIKQIMFATGGQALTDPEITKLGPKMESSYKTEKQWVEDLKDVRQRILDKVRMMRPNPNDSNYGGQEQSAESMIGSKPVFGNQQNTQYSVGQVISSPNGKKYRIVGGDMSDPDVEEVR